MFKSQLFFKNPSEHIFPQACYRVLMDLNSLYLNLLLYKLKLFLSIDLFIYFWYLHIRVISMQ